MINKDTQRVRRGFDQLSGTLNFSNSTDKGSSFAYFFPTATSIGSGSGTVRVDNVVLPVTHNIVMNSPVLGNLQITGIAPPTGLSHQYGRHIRIWRTTNVGGSGFAQPTTWFMHDSGFSTAGNKILINQNPAAATYLSFDYYYVDLVYMKNPTGALEDYWIIS